MKNKKAENAGSQVHHKCLIHWCLYYFIVFRSKRNAVRIPKASNRKLKASHRREREQAPHQQTPGANTAENGSSDGND